MDRFYHFYVYHYDHYVSSPWEMKTQMDSNEQALQTQLTYVYGEIAGILIMLIIGAYYRIYYHPI